MNTSELRGERIRQKKNVKYMAKVIGKSEDAYAKKERGVVKFDPNEMVAIQNDLHLSPALFNAIFLTQNYCSVSFRKSCHLNCNHCIRKGELTQWKVAARKVTKISTSAVGKRLQNATTS